MSPGRASTSTFGLLLPLLWILTAGRVFAGRPILDDGSTSGRVIQKSQRWVSDLKEVLRDGDSVIIQDRHQEWQERLSEVVSLKHATWPSLSLPSTRVSLCAGGPFASPFTQGTILEGERQARLTVFEVELLHDQNPSEYRSLVGAPPTLSALAFLESGASIKDVQWKGWGAGIVDEMASTLQLKCRIYPGHDRAARSNPPYYEIDAEIISSIEWPYTCFFNIRCPLKKESPFFTASKFQVEFVLKHPNSGILHLDPLPICRRSPKKPFTRPPVQISSLAYGKPQLPKELFPLSYGKIPLSETENIKYEKPNLQNDEAKTTVAMCIRAYQEHSLFSTGKATHSTERLYEFLDYHLLIGVTRFYFYDRYGSDMQKDLQPYIDRGLVIFKPFPVWSEVFYRREWFFNKSITPYDFPAAYDQVINNEHCLMQGRRNNDTWMIFTDTDEFLSYPSKSEGGLPSLFDEISAKNLAERGKVASEISIRRYNFHGANATGDLVLSRCTQRCRAAIPQLYFLENGEVDKERTTDYKNKVVVRPEAMMGSQVYIHRIFGSMPSHTKAFPKPEEIRIHHYRSTPQKLYFADKTVQSVCNKPGRPYEKENVSVEDDSLVWAAARLEECTKKKGCEGRERGGRCGNTNILTDIEFS